MQQASFKMGVKSDILTNSDSVESKTKMMWRVTEAVSKRQKRLGWG